MGGSPSNRASFLYTLQRHKRSPKGHIVSCRTTTLLAELSIYPLRNRRLTSSTSSIWCELEHVNNTGLLAQKGTIMDVTKEDFEAFEHVRSSKGVSGEINMLDFEAVAKEAYIDQKVVEAIIKDYLHLKYTYDVKLRTGNTMQAIKETQYKGSIFASHNNLVEAFGKPFVDYYDQNTDRVWLIPTPYGIGTIYSTPEDKQYRRYDAAIDLTEAKAWHVGGCNMDTYEDIVGSLKSILQSKSSGTRRKK